MKALFTNIFAILIIVGLAVNTGLKAQTSRETGDWEEKTTWEENISVPLTIKKNKHNFDTIKVNDSHTVNLGNSDEANKDLSIEKNFTIEVSGSLEIFGNVDASNGTKLTIIVNDGGELIIHGDVNVHNHLSVDIKEGGIFVVDGSIDMHNQASMEVNGDLVADKIKGHNQNTNTIEGTGNLYVHNISGMDYDAFTGYIVGDETLLSLASPENLDASVDADLKISLTWEYVESTPDGYEFAGFQVFRNLGGSLHYDEIVQGVIENSTFSGNKDLNFDDSHEYSPGDAPVYYVRAVYQQTNKSEGYKFSPISNQIDFSNSPLPIELLYFKAKAVSGQVYLEWGTATEINNDYFTIERSMDGINWEVITFETGAGNSNHTRHYSFTDQFPVDGISYYRLKQTDYDGKFEYFQPAAVELTNTELSSEIVNTRVSGGTLYVTYKNEIPGSKMVVADMRGRVLTNTEVDKTGYNQEIQIALPANYTGELVMVRLFSSEKSDDRTIMVR
ncbi:MAG: hypothetical protein ACLFQS_06215 [Bacteroidales bacterium]